MTKQVHLDRLASLSEASLGAVVAAVEDAVIYGNGWLARQDDGDLIARDTTKVVIEERP